MRGNGQFDAWVRAARSIPIEREIARRGIQLKRVGAEHIGPCPKCGGTDRFAIHLKKQCWNCRQCKKETDTGDVIGFTQWIDDCDFIAAVQKLTGEPPPKTNGKDRATAPKEIVVSEFHYLDETGRLEFVVERIQYRNVDGSFVQKDNKPKKQFRQKRPDPDHPGKWINNIQGCRGLPYRLPEVIEAIANDHPIAIVEGEAKADLLASWNTVATCNAGGAKNWKAQHASFLKDADVILVPDHDDVGRQHANVVGGSLVGIARRIRMLVLPGLRPKGDIINWAADGGTREKLDILIESAPDWQPSPGAGETDNEAKAEAERSKDELLDALAKMPKGIERAREIKRLAKEWGVNRSDVEAEIARRAKENQPAPLHGHWIVEPWPEPADGDALIRDIIRKLRKHVVCSHEDALAVALWIMLAWVHDEVAIHSPILDVTSAEPMSGKSTTLGLIAYLAPRCLPSVEISEAALFRSIELWQPSFAIDEFDTVLVSDEAAGLRSVINSGHTRGQGIIRCVEPDYRPRHFKTFAPKAIGMVGRKLPVSTISRCVVIELRRRRKDEPAEKFEHKDDGELADLRRRLFRWSLDNADTFCGAKPLMPDQFDNRREDNWRLQFAIADLAGVDWGELARAAAVKIESSTDSRTSTVLLLAAIKIIFESIEDDAIGSEELCDKLAADPGSEWGEWGKSRKPITQNQLARMLKTHGIRPDQVRPKTLGGRQIRGYYRSWFEDAWARYL
jgi:hypothetical protein